MTIDDQIVERIVTGMITGHTCSDACWYARQETCRCSCEGANHGILKDGDGVRPIRMRQIKGKRYELDSVHPWESKARDRLEELGNYRYASGEYDEVGKHHVQRATKAQLKWDEVKPFICEDKADYWFHPYLVWGRTA